MGFYHDKQWSYYYSQFVFYDCAVIHEVFPKWVAWSMNNGLNDLQWSYNYRLFRVVRHTTMVLQVFINNGQELLAMFFLHLNNNGLTAVLESLAGDIDTVIPLLEKQRLTRRLDSIQLRALGSRSRIHERTIYLRLLCIILRFLRLEVSVYNVYITNQFQTNFSRGGGGGGDPLIIVILKNNK